MPIPCGSRIVWPVVVAAMAGLRAAVALAQLTGAIGIHDPSSIVRDGATYHVFGTGTGVAAKSSRDKVAWLDDATGVFSVPPAWTTQAVPAFTGVFWAPDVAFFNNAYHLYYSVSTWGSIDSAIGVATSPSLAAPTWTDRGKVIQSDAVWDAGPTTDTTVYNAIDPSLLVDDATGKVWMSWGSYSSGIMVTQIDPATGKRLAGAPLGVQVANNSGSRGWGSSIEGSSLVKKWDSYYLFVNYGGCCAGVDSTYEIRVGRSSSPTGPFLDRNGVDMRDGGGTLFLDDDGRMVGPGHFDLVADSGTDSFSYHYYNADANGAPTLGVRTLHWTADGWPSYAAENPDWSGAASSSWSAVENWSSGRIPDGVGQVANFATTSAGRYGISLSGGGRTAGTINFRGIGRYTVGAVVGNAITLDAAAGDAATVNVASGTHAIAAPLVAADPFALNTTTGARLNLDGAVTAPHGLTKYGRGIVAVNGTASITQPMLVRWGGVEVNGVVVANGYLSLGPAALESGTMTVRGTGMLVAKADLNVGDVGTAADAATGVLEVRDGGTVAVHSGGALFVGSGYFAGTRASGTVLQSGGTVTVTNAGDGFFVVGGRGSNLGVGRYELSGGTVNANTNVRIGGYGSGIVNQTGGTFTSGNWIALGRFAGADGEWTISSGTLAHTGTSTALIVGEGGTGALVVGGAGVVSTSGGLRLGLNGSGSGLVTLDGGTIVTPAVSRGGGAATFTFNGGTLRASASGTGFFQGLTLALVGGGGAVIDTQAFTVAIAQSLGHDPATAALDGGLVKRGLGTLTLASANTFTGTTRVEAGTLRLGHPAALTAGRVVIASDATLAIDDGVTASLAALTFAGGRLDLDAGRLEVAADGITLEQLVDALRAGRGDGRWNGAAGITSTAVRTAIAAGASRTVGWIEAGAGLLLAAAAPGDANMDGSLDLLDAASFLAGGRFDTGLAATWIDGDFGYDGLVDVVDVADLLASGLFDAGPYGVAAEPPLAAVPEPSPGATSLMSVAVASLACRRRLQLTMRAGSFLKRLLFRSARLI